MFDYGRFARFRNYYIISGGTYGYDGIVIYVIQKEHPKVYALRQGDAITAEKC